MSTVLPRYCCAIDVVSSKLGERLLADRDEDLELVADAAQLIGDLDEPHLGEVPDVRRQLAGVARARRRLRRDVLVEVLVDVVDEDRDRRRDARRRGISWLSVSVARAEEVAALEVEQVDEVVDDAAQVRVREQRVELRVRPAGRRSCRAASAPPPRSRSARRASSCRSTRRRARSCRR